MNEGNPISANGGTTEEDDLLLRSSKRMKEGDSLDGGGTNEITMYFLIISKREVLSYKDRLLGYNGDGYVFSEEEEDDADNMEDSDDETEEYFGEALKEKQSKVDWPIIPLPNEERRQLCSPWKKSLIINVLGKRISFKFLLAKLYRL